MSNEKHSVSEILFNAEMDAIGNLVKALAENQLEWIEECSDTALHLGECIERLEALQAVRKKKS